MMLRARPGATLALMATTALHSGQPTLQAGGRRRLWAAACLLLMTGAVVLAVAVGVSRFPKGLTVLICLFVALVAASFGVRRRGAARLISGVVAAALVIAALAFVVLEHRVIDDILVVAAVVAALACARMPFRVHVRWPAAQAPAHPVLFYNPLSGGGKAARFHLPREARRRGIEPVELSHGDDLETLVRDAVRRGADGLAMAGGDGSQAVVAMIASELQLPYACIPAGTRNHFALDLGVDRDDVVGALDAFVHGGERRVDLAEINGRVFVNNVSLGLYADAVQRPGYREAKLHTLLNSVPDVLGPDAAPPQISWSGAGGRRSAAALLVSNNAYRLARALTPGTRAQLDRGELGITALMPAAVDASQPRRKLQMEQWSDETFTIDAEGPVPAGIDGEAVMLDPPLRFRILPGALRVRIAPQHPGVSPSTFVPETPGKVISGLVSLVVHGDRALAQPG